MRTLFIGPCTQIGEFQPPWSFPKTAFFASVGSLAGLAFSSIAVAASLYSSFSTFQNKDRFKEAIENLREGRAAEQSGPFPNAPHRVTQRPRSQDSAADSGSSSWPQQGTAATADGSTSPPFSRQYGLST